MKRLYVPFLINKNTFVENGRGIKLLPDVNKGTIEAYETLEKATEAAHQIALEDPKGKVVIFVSDVVVEAKRVEFTQKKYNDKGELLV